MGSFNGFILTNSGKRLLEEALTGKRLTFTKFQFGDGESTEDSKDMTAMVNVNKETTINQIENNGNGQVMLRVIINNRDVESGYYVKEIGVMAKCDDGEEVLYAYNKAIRPDFLPVYNGINLVELEYQNYITIAQIEDVTAIIDENFTYLTKEEANEKFVKQTQLAQEENPGIITLNEVYEVGMPSRGRLVLSETITYKELWDLQHGVYTINSDVTVSSLGISGLYGAGVLKVYKPSKIDENDIFKLYEYKTQSVERPSAQAGKAFLVLYRETGEQYANIKITDVIDIWNDKWKVELNVTSEKIGLSNPGYLKMGNGLIIQWGIMSSSVNNTDYKYFPIAFENAVFMGVSSYSNLDSSGMGTSFQKVDKSRFLLGCRLSNGTLITGYVQWIAIGH